MTWFFANWRIPHPDPLAEFALGLDWATPTSRLDRIEPATQIVAMRAWWSREAAPALPRAAACPSLESVPPANRNELTRYP